MSSSGYGSGPVPPGVGMGPEALNPHAQRDYADYGQRAGAAVIDLLVKAAVAVALLAVVGSVTGIGFLAGDETSGIVALLVAVAMWFVAMALVTLLYEPVYMASTDGRTLGKQVMGCRVVRADGAPMTFGLAFLREVVIKLLAVGVIGNSVTAGLPVASLVDNLWPLWDGERRALHDLAVDTRVVKD